MTHSCKIGFPQSLISDNAPNLISRLLCDFCKKYNVEKVNSCPYYPEGNSIIERLFRTSKDMIYATSKENDCDWVQSIPLVNIALRCSYIGRNNYELKYNGKTFRRNELQMKSYPQQLSDGIDQEEQV